MICSDITIEALADRLEKTPRGTLVAVDELSGWFNSLGQYKSGRGGDVEHYLSMHRAAALKVDRKNGDKTTIYVPNAAVCITGTIQPDVLARRLSAEYYENGLAARFLLAMPPQRKKQWSDAEVQPATKDGIKKIFNFLFGLSLSHNEPIELPLTPEAKAVWVEFYNLHAQEESDLAGTELGAAWAKLEGYAARLALLIHCLRDAADELGGDPFHVDETSIAAGIKLAEWFGNETKRVYATMRESPDARRQRLLLEQIESKCGGKGHVTLRELSRSLRTYANTDEWDAALNELVHAGLLVCKYPPPSPGGGRPSRRYSLASLSNKI